MPTKRGHKSFELTLLLSLVFVAILIIAYVNIVNSINNGRVINSVIGELIQNKNTEVIQTVAKYQNEYKSNRLFTVDFFKTNAEEKMSNEECKKNAEDAAEIYKDIEDCFEFDMNAETIDEGIKFTCTNRLQKAEYEQLRTLIGFMLDNGCINLSLQ
jgi:uncharacterized protein (UPF0333 family)